MITFFFTLLIYQHEDASLEMIDKIFKSIEQKFINEEEINFIKDLIKVNFFFFKWIPCKRKQNKVVFEFILKNYAFEDY